MLKLFKEQYTKMHKNKIKNKKLKLTERKLINPTIEVLSNDIDDTNRLDNHHQDA